MLFTPKKINTATVTISLAWASAVERIGSILVLILITRLFGINAMADMYFVVMFLPVTIGTFVDNVTYGTVMNVLSKSIEGSGRDLWRDTCHIITGSGALLLCAVGLVMLAAKLLVYVQAPGLDPEVANQAGSLLRYASVMIFFAGAGAVLSNVLIHHDMTMLGVLRAPVVTITSLSAAIVMVKWGGLKVEAFVYGYIIGSVIGFLMVSYGVWRLKGNRKFNWNVEISDHVLREYVRVSALSTGTNMVYYLMIWFERVIASLMFPGAITVLNMAKTFITLIGFLPGAFSNAIFKRITGNREVFGGSFASSIRDSFNISLLLGGPILVGAVILEKQIIGFLFSGQNIAGKEEILIATATAILAGFIHIFLLGTVVRIYQAASRFLELLYYFLACFVLYAILSVILSQYFGVVGLGVAYSLALNALTIILLIRIALTYRISEIFWDLMKVCIISWLTYEAARLLLDASGAHNFIISAGMVMVEATIIYLALGYLMNNKYIKALCEPISKRIGFKS